MPVVFSRIPRTIFLSGNSRPVPYKTKINITDAEWERLSKSAGPGTGQIENLSETKRDGIATREEAEAHGNGAYRADSIARFPKSRIRVLQEAQAKDAIAKASRTPTPRGEVMPLKKVAGVDRKAPPRVAKPVPDNPVEPGMEGAGPELTEQGKEKLTPLIREQRKLRERKLTMTDFLTARIDKLLRLIKSCDDLALLKQFQLRIPSSKKRPETDEALAGRIAELEAPTE